MYQFLLLIILLISSISNNAYACKIEIQYDENVTHATVIVIKDNNEEQFYHTLPELAEIINIGIYTTYCK